MQATGLVDVRGGKAMRRCETADRSSALAHELWRLTPDRRDPEAFHLQKSTMIAELRAIAREMGRCPSSLLSRPLAQTASVLVSPPTHSVQPRDCRWCRRRQLARKRPRLRLKTQTYSKMRESHFHEVLNSDGLWCRCLDRLSQSDYQFEGLRLCMLLCTYHL